MRFALGCIGYLALVSGKVYFSETFGDDWETRWKPSTWKESEGHQGKWSLATGKHFNDEKEDRGLSTAEDSKFFGMSTNFDTFSNAGKELIVQYQIKYEKDVECGGGYMKLGPKIDDPAKFGDPTVYNIMFGPDQCGYTKRTHLIFNYKGKNTLKTKDLDFKQDDQGISHLYRMTLRPDNTVRVEVDEETIYEGSVKDDWEMLMPKIVDDLNDFKPHDWAEDSKMDDPDSVRPADWVTVKRVDDPDAKQPSDWDEEEDGEWEAPMKDNPAYKGEWVKQRLDNPNYKGFWNARKIENPDYIDDDVYKFDAFGFIGFDLWQVKGHTIFDNIIICDDKADADAFTSKWKALNEHEKAEKKKEDDAKPKEEEKKADDDDDDEKDAEKDEV